MSKRTHTGRGFGAAGRRDATQRALAAEAAQDLLAGLPAGTVLCYTDGACRGNPGPAGCGAVVALPNGRVGEASEHLGAATNNIAELRAIALALEMLAEAQVGTSEPVALLTDSSYAHGVLCLGWKAKANVALISELRVAVAQRPGLEIHWVAGHAGVAGNERADELANTGLAGHTERAWTDARQGA